MPAVPVPVVHEQYEDLAKQDHALRFGMWLFLASEVLLFAGLFALYVSYRGLYGPDFTSAAGHNDLVLGTTNTFVLITSSFTMAWAVFAMRTRRPRTTVVMLAATLGLGGVFLVIKSFEYAAHFKAGLLPGARYAVLELGTFGAGAFFAIYYVMTGLHALHVIAGMSILLWLLLRTRRGGFSAERHVALELGGLYWHLVDLIWIYLWPLLYLVR